MYNNILRNTSAVLALGLEPQTFFWWLDLLCLDRVIRIRPNGVVLFCYSTETPIIEDAPYNIVDIKIERRKLNPIEIASNIHSINCDESLDYWILKMHGGCQITLVCESFTLHDNGEWEDQIAHR